MEWYGVILYIAAIWIAVLTTPVGLPGPLLIAGAAALAGWLSHWIVVRVWVVVVFVALALLAEILEHWLAAAGARSYGSTRAGVCGSFLGGLCGALVGFPVFLLGSLIGAFLGAFLGAALLELLISGKNLRDACRAGYGAFRGRVGAMILKTVLALSMAVTATLFASNYFS